MDRYLLHVGMLMLVVSAATLGLSTYLARLRARKQRVEVSRSRSSDVAGYLLLAMFFLGLALATSSPLVPDVDGTVVDLQSGKGNHFTLVVETARGRYDVVGDPDARDRCPRFSHIVKRSWTMEYACNGSPAGSARVAIFVVLFLETMAGIVPLVAAVLRVFK